ncbi:uncharacterized protein DDB_G0287625 [Drosophila erecta]|uniref:Uncharacterized protein n=1 Tax=Drosophila erecta TaxID=7220 RepID=B3NSD4_DROER|nr:uncharacterized protein DDB_G0287625 [Drosophila erecta]EDV56436.2 uncharacterized protein Dere_GG20216 [Drosophila erecta]
MFHKFMPNVRTIFILMSFVIATARPAGAAKNVLTLSKHSELALHINSHGKVTAENILRTYQYFTMEAVNDVFSLDFKITIYSADVDYYLCFHHGRLVGKRDATKDCHFKEGIFMGNQNFSSAYNPVLRVGFKGNFKPIGLKDFSKPKVMKKAILFFFPLNEEKFNLHLAEVLSSSTTTTTTTTTTSTTTTPPPPSTTTTTTTTTTPASPVEVTKRTRPKSRRPTSINSNSSKSNIPDIISRHSSNSLKSYNQANSNNNNNELDLQQQQVILQRNRKLHRRRKLQQKKRQLQHQQQQQQQQHHRRHRQYGTVGVMAKPQPKNLDGRHHHNNATMMERRRRRLLERQQHKLQRELWEREQREAGDRERERERVEHLPKATSSASSSSSSSSTATSTALTATAASLAPSAFNLVAIMAASRRKRDRRKRSAGAAAAAAAGAGAGATGGGATRGGGSSSSSSPPDADMQLVELPSQRLQQQDEQSPQNEYSKPYVNSNLNLDVDLNVNVKQLIDSNSVSVNHAIPALPKNYNYLYSNEHYNLNTKSSTTDSSSLDVSTKFDSPNSHSPSHSHSAFNQNIDNNLKHLTDRIELASAERQVETTVTPQGETDTETDTDTDTVTTETVVQNRNHIDANNIIDDSYPNDEEHGEQILKKLLRGLRLQQQHVQQQQQPNIENPNENINVVNNNQNHNDGGLLTNNNHNSNYNEQFANDDETIRIQNNKYETHIVQYKHAVFIWQ